MPVVLFLLVVWNPGETSTPGIPGQNILFGLKYLKEGGPYVFRRDGSSVPRILNSIMLFGPVVVLHH